MPAVVVECDRAKPFRDLYAQIENKEHIRKLIYSHISALYKGYAKYFDSSMLDSVKDHCKFLRELGEVHLEELGDAGPPYYCNRDYGITMERISNAMWGLYYNGELLGRDQYRNDLAPRFGLKLD